jgi:hypothetical protein
MRKLFCASILLIACIHAKAQTDTIKSFSDLPSRIFETASLKGSDTTAINKWFKDFAAVEEPHIDSILHHTIILDSASTWVWLVRLKAMCQFINSDWKNLAYADTTFRNMQRAYIIFRLVGMAELSSYAKAKLHPGVNFAKTYLDTFKQSIDTLNNSYKEMFIGFMLTKMKNAKAGYEEKLAKFSDTTAAADTSLYSFVTNYVFHQLKCLKLLIIHV